MKTLFWIIFLIYAIFFISKVRSQDETIPAKSEFYVYVQNMPCQYKYNNAIIVMEQVSTVWGSSYRRSTLYTLPLLESDSLCYDYASRFLFPMLPSYDTLLIFEAGGWDGDPVDMYFAWGKYKVTIGYGVTGLDDNNKWLFFHHDSMYIDFTDSNYEHYTSTYVNSAVDFGARFNWDSTRWNLTRPKVKYFTNTDTVKVWDNTWNLRTDTLPRVTNCFTPAAPKNFTLGSSSGNPYLSWTSNGETFPIRYKIYRKLNNKYGTYTNIADTTSTNYTDEEISCAGYGNWTAYYYVLAKNNSTGSTKVSSSTDTMEFCTAA